MWEKDYKVKLGSLSGSQKILVAFLVKRHFSALRQICELPLSDATAEELKKAMSEAVELVSSCESESDELALREAYKDPKWEHEVNYSYTDQYTGWEENPVKGLGRKLATHCANGHAFSEENTLLSDRGMRRCKICVEALQTTICRNGHERTEENTRFTRGKRYCKVCQKEADAIRRKRFRAKESVEKGRPGILNLGAV